MSNEHSSRWGTCAGLILASLLIFLPVTAHTAPAPRIASPAADYDFGEVSPDSPLIHVFTIQNTGTATLNIERIRANCGCSSAAAQDLVIPPGSNTTVTVTHNLRQRLGAQRLSVFVHSNDPINPLFQLLCKGTVTTNPVTAEALPERASGGNR